MPKTIPKKARKPLPPPNKQVHRRTVTPKRSEPEPRRKEAMSTQPTHDQKQPPPPPAKDQRGAGSGKQANEKRENLVDWPPPYKSHSDHVAELEAEAEAQAEHNSKVADLTMAAGAAFTQKMHAEMEEENDPETKREENLEQAQKENDPKAKEAALKGEMDARAKRDKEAEQKK